LNPKEFAKWIDRIYTTEEEEFDCNQTQTLLPAYVEAEFNGTQPTFASDIEIHLSQCPDCMETYQGLYYVMMEANGELSAAEKEKEGIASTPESQSVTRELTPMTAP
jgi:predicted anti-sigma-YlaC factor YlaD